MATMKKVIINAAITGMVPTKEQNPDLPVHPQEIIQTALECARLGASIVHIHPRDENGAPTWKKEIFAEIISGIREENEQLIISVTTSGRLWQDFRRRSECLELTGDLKPDLASLTLGSMNFINQESINSPTMIRKLASKMMEKGIKPELEVFEPGMVHLANYLLSKDVLENDSPYFNVLLGSLGTSPPSIGSLNSFFSVMPSGAIWSLAGIGSFQLMANVMSLSAGGNVRIGLEDNLFFNQKKTKLASNQSLIARLTKIMKLMDIAPSTPQETRVLLGLDRR